MRPWEVVTPASCSLVAGLLQLWAECVRAREVFSVSVFALVAETCLSSRVATPSALRRNTLRGSPGASPPTTQCLHHGERPGSSCTLEKNLLQPLACLIQPLSQPPFPPLSQTLLQPLFQPLFQRLFQPLCQPLAGCLSQPLATLRREPALLQTGAHAARRKPTLLGPVT